VPQVITYDPSTTDTGKRETHWYIKNTETGEIRDPTVRQYTDFGPGPDYSQGRGCGFMTTQPSIRAATILNRVLKECHEAGQVPQHPDHPRQKTRMLSRQERAAISDFADDLDHMRAGQKENGEKDEKSVSRVFPSHHSHTTSKTSLAASKGK